MAEKNEILEPYTQKWWCNELSKREKELDDKWRRSADMIVKRYLDEREESNPTPGDDAYRKYNIFWANTQITMAALYATPPKPLVTRQYGDAKDDVARTAALILQRMLQFDLMADDSETHNAFRLGVEDRLIPGLGQVWMRYEPEIEQVPAQPAGMDPTTGMPTPEQPAYERIVDERVRCDYVQWRDFRWESSRIWKENGWVARDCWMRKKDFIKRFGKEKYENLKGAAKGKATNDKLPKGFTDYKILVTEVWCLDTNKAYWVNPVADELLDSKDDPLQLEGFFPCPQTPITGTVTSNSTIPRPDYTMVQDQYEELDILNCRIAGLTKSLRVVGVYDKTNSELKNLISGPELNMIPVDNWDAFAEKGGLKGQVDWFPVEVIAGVLEKLMAQRVAVINQIYELTSISDIMRGASNPRDTLGAQKMKAQYSSVRLQLSQQSIGRWVREALRIKVEIIARHFQPETIKRQSQIMFTESAQFADAAIELIKNYKDSEYRIQVGEETLSLADYNAERELRTEYLTAVGQFLSQAAQMVAGQPEALPYMLRMIAWVTAAFRGSADVESVLDEAIKQAASAPPKQEDKPPPKPSPDEEAAAQIKVENAKVAGKMKTDVVNALAQNLFKKDGTEEDHADV